MAAVRVSLSWFGVRKTLTPDQKAQAAESFGAEGAFLSAGKKLLDTRHPAYRAVAAVRHHAVAYWRGISLPYPEAGIRLIRQRDIAPFNVQLTTLRAELTEKVTELDQQYSERRASGSAVSTTRPTIPLRWPTSSASSGIFPRSNPRTICAS
jgi:hypothetical protein